MTVGLAFVAVGCAIIVLAAVGALVVRGDVFTRLHFLTPVTSLGVPLLAIGLSIQDGIGLDMAQILLIAAMLFISGPVLEIATGRLAAQHDGPIAGKSPK
jgi:multicomponent Na+:H+ antiporter subunit G